MKSRGLRGSAFCLDETWVTKEKTQKVKTRYMVPPSPRHPGLSHRLRIVSGMTVPAGCWSTDNTANGVFVVRVALVSVGKKKAGEPDTWAVATCCSWSPRHVLGGKISTQVPRQKRRLELKTKTLNDVDSQVQTSVSGKSIRFFHHPQ